LQDSKIVRKFEILDFKSGKDFYYIKIKTEIKKQYGTLYKGIY